MRVTKTTIKPVMRMAEALAIYTNPRDLGIRIKDTKTGFRYEIFLGGIAWRSKPRKSRLDLIEAAGLLLESVRSICGSRVFPDADEAEHGLLTEDMIADLLRRLQPFEAREARLAGSRFFRS